ncbi:hypothetical protein [Mariniflexile sp.]|uniref:hypothetical protein n=1 Tax=Mariniflexile sp. TaxID=1979402 RepID=UPI004047E9A9
MNRIKFTKIKQIFKVFKYLLLFVPAILISQNEMLISQLSEKQVTRENFDKDGSLLNKQTFKIGKIKTVKKYYEIEVETELFDKSGKSTDKYTTSYRCRPEESSTIVMVFPFYNPKKMATEISVNSRNFKELYDLNNLVDLELEINFDSGLLNFFGSKSKIKIYDRNLVTNNSTKTIRSKLNAKAYALGIRIKEFEYDVIETLNDKNLLTFQKFTEEDGSYFTMTYK